MKDVLVPCNELVVIMFNCIDGYVGTSFMMMMVMTPKTNTYWSIVYLFVCFNSFRSNFQSSICFGQRADCHLFSDRCQFSFERPVSEAIGDVDRSVLLLPM